MYKEDKKMPALGFWQSGAGGFLKGLLWALGATLILLAVSSLIITYTSISEEVIPIVAMFSAIISIALGGFVSAKTATSKGYLKGSLCGIAYILVLYVFASLISEKFIFTTHTALLFVLGLVVGALGGIIGINSSGKRKR